MTDLTLDTALVFSTMKLLFLSAENIRSGTNLYQKVKRNLFLAEMQGEISVKMLQATLLVGLYEMANGILPAAYLTVGHCARMGHALGIHDRRNAPQMFPSPRTLCRSCHTSLR